MIDRTTLERLAVAGKPWAQEQLRDIEEDERQQAAAAADAEREAAAKAERERVHDVHVKLSPSPGDCGIFATGDLARLGPWVEGPDGRRYRIVPQRYHDHMPEGPWFLPAWWRPHLDAPHSSSASTFALEETPALFDVLTRRRGEYAAAEFLGLVSKANHDATVVWLAVFAFEAQRGSAASTERARVVDRRLRTLGLSLLGGDSGPRIDALRAEVRQLWDLEIPGQITEHIEPSVLETARQLRRATTTATTEGDPDAA